MKSVVAIFDNNWLSDWYDIPPESFLTVEVPFPENIPTFQPLPSVDDIWIDLTLSYPDATHKNTHTQKNTLTFHYDFAATTPLSTTKNTPL